MFEYGGSPLLGASWRISSGAVRTARTSPDCTGWAWGAHPPRRRKPSGYRAYVPRAVGTPRVLGLELVEPAENSGLMGLVPGVPFTFCRRENVLGHLAWALCATAATLIRRAKPYTHHNKVHPIVNSRKVSSALAPDAARTSCRRLSLDHLPCCAYCIPSAL